MSWFSEEKWPRVWAAEIMALPTKEERREMFGQVPEHLRDLVWAHCEQAVRGPHVKRNRTE
jgi:hypothetical protein